MKTCADCPKYNHGTGGKHCLRCRYYVQILRSSGQRKTVPIASVTQELLEAIPDNTSPTLWDCITKLPLDLFLIVACKMAGYTHQEIANHLNITRQAVDKKIAKSVKIVKGQVA